MEKLDKERYLKRVIVVCWVALAICFGIKLFGGNLFEIMCNNENFIKVCEYADNNFGANYLISFIFCFIHLYFYCLSIVQRTRYKKWELALVILTVAIGTLVKIYSFTFGFIFDIWQGFLLPMILIGNKFREYWKIVLANLLLMVFQLISMFVKNIEDIILGESVLIGAIFSIDVLLMLILYFCYANIIKKGDK